MQKRWRAPLILALVAVNLAILGVFIQAFLAEDASQWRTAANSGGAATRVSAAEDAFALPPVGLDQAALDRFFAGQRLFNIVFVRAPSEIGALDGRGPTFNRPSCGRCHERNGRGRTPRGDTAPMLSMVVKLSVGNDERFGPRAHPAYGLQLQDRAIAGVPHEGRALIRWVEEQGEYGDGTSFTLRRPEIRFTGLAFGPLAGARTSLRIAPPVFGTGLLQAIPEAAIRAAADPDDRDRDGISGRVQEIPGPVDQALLGRFGWKAGQPDLAHQSGNAFFEDMGLSTRLFPDQNCPAVQTACRAAPDGGSPEVSDEQLDTVADYVAALAVPARRNVEDPEVLRGGRLFGQIGCAACHTPTHRTGEAPDPARANQVIHPYTDLLLHDMGEGLADGRGEYRASGREWRTPPLWGIGLTETVNGNGFYLHDGRARSLAEAILWHGGEAESAREAFRTLPAADRAALLAFLRSL